MPSTYPDSPASAASADVGDSIESGNAQWSFDGALAESFVEHISRSVPFYEEGHELVCQLSDYFVARDSVVYELGCSTGELLRKLADHSDHKPAVRWVGIDNQQGMVDEARRVCTGRDNIELYCDDVLAFDFEKTDLIVAYYTLQFVPERYRQALIDRIYGALNWGGAFILFEKVGAPDSRFQDIMSGLYRDFKRSQGFTAEQILNKDASLKGVLKPFSTGGNRDLLRRAGFVDFMTVMKYVCFEGFIAIK
jgi:tRNA (cmo5U34)-methyltransferase